MDSNTEGPQSTDQPGTGQTSTGQTGTGPTPDSHERPPLRRPVRGRMLAGVCVAIGRHFNIDVTIVRVIFAVLTIAGFTGLALGGLPLYLGGIPLYLACWLLIPEEGSDQSIAGGFVKNRQRGTR
jgi:phage shock protein PspC (stress-responsive transcriptional regulator)